MCKLHPRKVGWSYAKLNSVERRLVDEAWRVARMSNPALGWVLEAIVEGLPQLFSASAIDGQSADLDPKAAREAIAAAELKAIREAIAAGCTTIRRAVVVHERGYWPSKAFVELLVAKALPTGLSQENGRPLAGSDMLFVNHTNGVIVSWDVEQLQACDHTQEKPQLAAELFERSNSS
jgi:hypothetical protein